MKTKYRNIPTMVDGIRFASKREARRYGELALMQKAGLIRDLRLQVPFDLWINEVKVCRYVCDFQYHEAGKLVVEDAKGFKTAEYKLKKKLMLAVFGIEIREV